MITIDHQDGGYLEITFGGQVTHEDYQAILPKMEQAIAEHGKLRVLCIGQTVEGATPRAMLDDLKWDWKHRKDIEKCAVVVDGKMMEMSVKLVSLIYKGEIKRFESGQVDEARAWLAV